MPRVSLHVGPWKQERVPKLVSQFLRCKRVQFSGWWVDVLVPGRAHAHLPRPVVASFFLLHRSALCGDGLGQPLEPGTKWATDVVGAGKVPKPEGKGRSRGCKAN